LRLRQTTRLFETGELTRWTHELCEALAYAHAEAQVVHRDLKPSNLMIDGRDRLKVTDFGIAASVSDTVTRVTKVSSSGGTPAYASPQQIMGEAPSPADDIYSLGATLYELLTSKPPFYTGNLLIQVQTRRPPALAARRAELRLTGAPIPPAWEEVIAACLEKDPALRPASPAEIAARLTHQPVRSGAVAPPTPPEFEDSTVVAPLPPPSPVLPVPAAKVDVDLKGPPPVPARRAGRPLVWIGALAAAAATILLAVLYPWTHRERPIVEAPSGPTTGSPSADVHAPVAALKLSIDPPDAPNLRISVGSQVDLRPEGGILRISDLPDGDHEVTVTADGYQSIATRIHVAAGNRERALALVPLRGRLEITTSPGATATAVDNAGVETRLGVADAQGRLTNEDTLRTGRYTIRLTAEGRRDAESVVDLTATDPATLALPLSPLPAELRVQSDPAGATVSLNGRTIGPTPVIIREVPAEQVVQLVATLPGHRPDRQELTLRPKEARTVNLGPFEPERGSVLLHFTDPDVEMNAVSFSIDGQVAPGDMLNAGWSDKRFSDVPAGRHTITAVDPDHEPWSQAITVVDGREVAVEVSLVARTGTVVISSTPAGASVDFEPQDGQRLPAPNGGAKPDANQTPFRRVLPPGNYIARFTLAGYEEVEETIEVVANQNTQLKVRLVELTSPEPLERENDRTDFDHPRGLISFSYPSQWQPLAPTPQFGNTFSFGDATTRLIAQVYEVPGAGNPDMAMNMIAQAVGPYGVQFSIQGAYAQGYGAHYEGTTTSAAGTSRWVGLFQAVPGGVVGLVVGSPAWTFDTNRDEIDQVIESVEFQ